LRPATFAARDAYERECEALEQLEPGAALFLTLKGSALKFSDPNVLHQSDDCSEKTREDTLASSDHTSACTRMKDVREKIKELKADFEKLEGKLLEALLELQLLVGVEWDASRAHGIRTLPGTEPVHARTVEEPEISSNSVRTQALSSTQKVPGASYHGGIEPWVEPVAKNTRKKQAPRIVPSSSSHPASSLGKRVRSVSEVEQADSTAKRMRKENDLPTNARESLKGATGAMNVSPRRIHSIAPRDSP
jgi:hypothetical protein